jgi:hyperosmotically inducible protein
MKKLLVILVLLLAAPYGCITAYKTVVDVRDLSVIASDTRIKLAILDEFVADEKVKTLEIFAACYEGRVYLVGEYGREEHKMRAIEIAKGVEGVKGVSTYLLEKKKDHPCTTKVNLNLTAKVKGRLVKDKDIWSTNIDVKTVQCNVVLVGLVGSKNEVRKAVAHAKAVEGVKSVKVFLTFPR